MSSNRLDIEVIGISAVQKYRVAASATRFYAGEPVNFAAMTYSGGISDINTITQAADATPVIVADTASADDASFVGIAAQRAEVNNAGTVIASWVDVIEPIPNFTRMRGIAETTSSVDTLTELIGVFWDYALWTLTSPNIFSIDDTTAPTDTSGLRIMGGVWERGLLDVVVDFRAMRVDITT